MIEIRRILCPVDFSDCSRRALDHAVAVARRYESTITALHVFSTAPVAAYAHGAPGPDATALTRADRDQQLDEVRRVSVLAEVRRFCEAGLAAGIPFDAVGREGTAAAPSRTTASKGSPAASPASQKRRTSASTLTRRTSSSC